MAKEFHRLIFLAAVLTLICSARAFPAEILTEQPLIIIDPGHDNTDPGLDSETGDRESQLTLALARKLSTLLSDTCRVQLTRTSPSKPLEMGRTERANHEKATLFLSLHLHNRQIPQPLIYVFNWPGHEDDQTWQTRANRSLEASKQLAQILADQLKGKASEPRPLIIPGPVLPLEGLTMPGILIEPFAPSQIPADPDKREAFLTDQAKPIADALMAFLKDKKTTP